MMPSHTPSVEEFRELRERGWQRLAAAVPAAIKVITERKAKLEARIDAGKKLSLRDRRQLERIHVLLDSVDQQRRLK